jgi:hypothetical protein
MRRREFRPPRPRGRPCKGRVNPCLPGGCIGQGAGGIDQSREIAGGNHSAKWPRRGRALVPLCPAVLRARHRPQDLGPTDHGDRPDRQHRGGLSALVRGMDCLRWAMRHQRDGGAAADGNRTDLCPALCAFHVGGNFRRRRHRRTRPQGPDAAGIVGCKAGAE